jgi:hypothetical protein
LQLFVSSSRRGCCCSLAVEAGHIKVCYALLLLLLLLLLQAGGDVAAAAGVTQRHARDASARAGEPVEYRAVISALKPAQHTTS